jgi:hypothetical protein
LSNFAKGPAVPGCRGPLKCTRDAMLRFGCCSRRQDEPRGRLVRTVREGDRGRHQLMTGASTAQPHDGGEPNIRNPNDKAIARLGMLSQELRRLGVTSTSLHRGTGKWEAFCAASQKDGIDLRLASAPPSRRLLIRSDPSCIGTYSSCEEAQRAALMRVVGPFPAALQKVAFAGAYLTQRCTGTLDAQETTQHDIVLAPWYQCMLTCLLHQ